MCNFGLSACPSKWLIPMKGIFRVDAIPLAKFKPTVRHIINPGPDVHATPEISLIFILLSRIALFAIKFIFSTCDRAASSGTTPPNSL